MAEPVKLPENSYDKDPEAELDYGFKWGEFWLASTETIISSTWDVPAGLTEVSNGIVVGGKTTFVWVSGGTLKKTYTLTNTIQTSEGRKDSRSLFITITDR